MPQAFNAKNPKGVAVDNPQNYRFISSDRGGANGQDDMMEHSFREMNETDATENSGATIAAIGGPSTPSARSPLDFLERTALDAQISSDRIRAISSRAENK